MLGYLSNIARQAASRTAVIKPGQPGSAARISCLLRGLALLFVLSLTLTIMLNRDRMAGFTAFGYFGAFLAMLLSNATLILPAPGLIFVFALGSTLNPLIVGVCAAVGAALGEMTGYLTGYSGLSVLENTPVANRVNQWMNRNGTLTIFFLSIIPNPLFDLAGIMAGTSRMAIWRFLGVAFCGKFIQSTLIALAGAQSINWVQEWLAH